MEWLASSLIMSWRGKERPTAFDDQPIPGLYFLDGDLVAREYRQEWVRGEKYPLIRFPSGVEREVEEQTGGEVIHIFGALDLPLGASRDEAYERAQAIGSEYDYRVTRQGQRELTVANPFSERRYRLEFDNERKRVVDIELYPQEAMELLTGAGRALLPPLYQTEALGAETLAPLKFFTPASRWTWYPTEFDGRDICFGLVSGFEVELGYFSISELEGVRDPLGLPIERDLYYRPQTINELMAYHKRER